MSLAAVASAFGVSAERIRLIKRSGNTHWAISDGADRYVLRRFGANDLASALWEHTLTTQLVALGYPAIAAIDAPREIDGALYALYPFARGKTWRFRRNEADYRALGVMLADHHEVAAKLAPRDQRSGWTRAADGAFPAHGGRAKRDELLAVLAGIDPDLAVTAARAADAIEPRLAASSVRALPVMPIHGDFSNWNLRIERDALSALFDFNFSYLDASLVDLAFSRRAYHDGVVRGYRTKAQVSDADVDILDALWLGIILRGLWLDLERSGAYGTKATHRWTAEQLAKTRPYAD